ncbi:hypothetical protein ABT354_04790 [Streptomyces sp. NPDC000594]|uniref:hypothetical protein n=1 Tax=Streptomyces sp. NPDC000594 TaxID=3154261 RepID=UPI00331D00B0
MRTTVHLLSSAVLAVATIGLGAPGALAAPGAHTTSVTGQAQDVSDPYSNKNENDSGSGRHSENQGSGQGESRGEGESQGQGEAHNNQGHSQSQGQQYEQPSGHVRTGVGGSVGPDTGQVAAGVAVLVTAAAGGTLLLRRRASGALSG